MKATFFALIAASALALPSAVYSHCQIPCGIYADNTVIAALHTGAETIVKAIAPINELSKDAGANVNQLARWVANKESHAQNIQDVVAQYFLAQRVKTAEAEENAEAYVAKLTLCHQVIVAAMTCKQSADEEAGAALVGLLNQFSETFGEKKE